MKKTILLLSILMMLALTGCMRQALLEDSMSAQLNTINKRQHSLKDVEEFIHKACEEKGWRCMTDKEGRVKAELIHKSRQVLVHINYSETQYTIDYVDSINMEYDGEFISGYYSGWVRRLMHRINNASLTTFPIIKEYNNIKPTLIRERALQPQDISKFILRACAQLQWHCNNTQPGVITAEYAQKTQSLLLNITYDSEQFSITYQDSNNYHYDGRFIHKSYDQQVQRLVDHIQTEARSLL